MATSRKFVKERIGVRQGETLKGEEECHVKTLLFQGVGRGGRKPEGFGGAQERGPGKRGGVDILTEGGG